MSQDMRVGDVLTWRRTFTEEDIRRFGRLTGDEGDHHVQPDAAGRFMAQGLLTATLPTKIGGDLNFIAREMVFRFRRPVFAGDTIECRVTLTALDEIDGATEVSCSWQCHNQHQKEVMSGHASGVIRTRSTK